MKKLNLTIWTIVISLFCSLVIAKSGCCSRHGGINHCDSDTGRIICNDVTFSPSCICESSSTNQKFSTPLSSPPPAPLPIPTPTSTPQPQVEQQSIQPHLNIQYGPPPHLEEQSQSEQQYRTGGVKALLRSGNLFNNF